MDEVSPAPDRQTVLAELLVGAVATFGAERAAEAALRAALETAATAVWRVMEEPLDPLDPGPRSGG